MKYSNKHSKETVGDMAIHALGIGFAAGLISFIYMGVFGHKLPSLEFEGPFFRKKE